MKKAKGIINKALKSVGRSPAKQATTDLQGLTADIMFMDDPEQLIERLTAPNPILDDMAYIQPTPTIRTGLPDGVQGRLDVLEYARGLGITESMIRPMLAQHQIMIEHERMMARHRRAEEEMRRNLPRTFDVRLDIRNNREARHHEMHAHLRVDIGNITVLPEQTIDDPAARQQWIDENVAAAVQDVARRLEAELTRNMMLAFETMRDPRPHDNRRAMRDRFDHGVDVFRGLMESHVAADITGAFSWAEGFAHTEFELNGWTAKCLTTAEAVRDEGNNMEHCLGKSYIVRIAQGDYLAYHIQPPANQGYPRSGFTLGVRRIGRHSQWHLDQVKGKRNQTHYNDDAGLRSITEMIVSMLN